MEGFFLDINGIHSFINGIHVNYTYLGVSPIDNNGVYFSVEMHRVGLLGHWIFGLHSAALSGRGVFRVGCGLWQAMGTVSQGHHLHGAPLAPVPPTYASLPLPL